MCISHIWLLATLWTVAHQALLSMGFSRWEYWSGLPSPPPRGIFLTQGWNPSLLRLPHALAGGFFTAALPGMRLLNMSPRRVAPSTAGTMAVLPKGAVGGPEKAWDSEQQPSSSRTHFETCGLRRDMVCPRGCRQVDLASVMSSLGFGKTSASPTSSHYLLILKSIKAFMSQLEIKCSLKR